jgi:CheY-like chemotaxis protein
MQYIQYTQYIENLLSYHGYNTGGDKQNERLINYDNSVSSREHDKEVMTNVQSNLSNFRNEDIDKEEGQVTENSIIRKTKTILIIDDDKDTTLAVKSSFEYENDRSHNRISFQVYTYNSPQLALSEFKPNFYDLLLIDIEMPKMNGFDLATKIMKIDANPKICFMSAAEVSWEALREIYPSVSFGCFIRKPVSSEYLIRKIKAELE